MRRIKIPEDLMSQKESIVQGSVVAIFMGRGCDRGIACEVSKRKSLVYFPYTGKKIWVENNKLFVVRDKRWIAEVLRSV